MIYDQLEDIIRDFMQRSGMYEREQWVEGDTVELADEIRKGLRIDTLEESWPLSSVEEGE